MSKNIKVVVPENYDPAKPIVIHLLEGAAPEPLKTVQEQSVKISGDINAPAIYAKSIFPRSGSVGFSNDSPVNRFPNEQAIVEYSNNPKNPWIELTLNPGQSVNTKINGVLKPNKEVELFGFNVDGKFTNKTFIDHIMKYPHCFATKGVVKQLRNELKNFSAQFKTLVKKADDSKGNTEDIISTEFDKTKANIPDQIFLKMPLFEGCDPVEFEAEVEIKVDMTSGKPEAKFGFFTMELEVQQREFTENIIKSQVDLLKEKFTCIRVNNQ
jgi:hypothetical protein